MTAFPSALTLSTGTLRAGDYSRLRAIDGSTLQVNAVGGTTQWSARTFAVPNSLKTLQIGYTGSSSVPCTQSVSIYNWTTASWVTLDTRTVGTTRLTLTSTLGGTLANYVSNVSGSGDVVVRVRCVGSTSGYFTSGDQLRIIYTP